MIIEIKGPGGTINYPTEVVVRALRDAGFKVHVEDEHPCPPDKVEKMMIESKNRIEAGSIRKVNVKTTHYPWGG